MASQTFTNTTIDHILTDEHASWYAAMLLPDGSVITADTLTELVAELISGYEPGPTLADTVDAFNTRVSFASTQANFRQGFLAMAASAEGEFDPEDTSEDDLTAIFSDRAEHTPTIASWGGQFPLVLVATDYYPHTEIPLPVGNVEVIDPTTERTLLQSLADLGDFELRYR